MHNSLKYNGLRHSVLKKSLLRLLLGVSSVVFTTKAIQTPLGRAISMECNVQKAELLIQDGADINERSDALGLTPLMSATLCDLPGVSLNMVQMLLAHNPDVNAVAVRDNTALHFALKRGDFKVATALVNAGADVNKVNKSGETPLLFAIRFNNPMVVPMLSLLIDKGARVDFKDRDGKTALDILREEPRAGDEEKVKILEEALHNARATRTVSADSGVGILEQAAHAASDDSGAGISKQAARVASNVREKYVDNMGRYNVVEHTHDFVKRLESGDLTDDNQIKQEMYEIYADLARLRAEGLVGPRAHTLLEEIMWKVGGDRGREISAKLLALGAPVNAPDLNGGTALINAAYQGDAKMVKTLLDYQADPNQADSSGDTPLMNAAAAGIRAGEQSTQVVRMLLTSGARVNAINNKGETALMNAAQFGLPDTVRALLQAGARVNMRTDYREFMHIFKTRKTALDYAKARMEDTQEQRQRKQEIIEILEAAQLSWWQSFVQWLEEDVERG